ncbi:MAG TPA: DISARM system phospholipase D-like protein DrmC [Glycomyces sp.]|nr:DISARM system phospholipase D-like protein DrmC [Glycomyces sp.]
MDVNPREATRARAGELVDMIGHAALDDCAHDIAAGTLPAIIAERIGRPEATEAIARLAEAARAWGAERAEAYLRGLCDGAARRQPAVRPVWTGPRGRTAPVRHTAAALIALIDACEHELWLCTYAAKPYRPLLDALSRALARGAAVSIAVETLAGAGSAIAGSEPVHAFAGLRGARRYSWPKALRPADAKLHAKLALADAETLLVTSANFTVSGLEHNLEAGLLITGGPAPAQTAAHLREMVESGVLERI